MEVQVYLIQKERTICSIPFTIKCFLLSIHFVLLLYYTMFFSLFLSFYSYSFITSNITFSSEVPNTISGRVFSPSATDFFCVVTAFFCSDVGKHPVHSGIHSVQGTLKVTVFVTEVIAHQRDHVRKLISNASDFHHCGWPSI